ncbi:MAG: CaiB/BaiF CoA transferase family protein [Pseudomonadota bacterium]|jgi:crotonobetainyl-CoA:carnitine CoA-transferase CaiB-like acyl-CoA transferase
MTQATTPQAATPPLAGMRVLDFSRLLPGPWATQLLGALGADVVKVEQPGVGDLSRHNHPRLREESVYFNGVNANKRSVAIDLARPEGAALLPALLGWADVVIESFRPGVARRLGIDAETVRGCRPDVIHCSISGFGQTGPLSNIAGHDLVIQAATGVMGCQPRGDVPPEVPGFQSADFAGAMTAVVAVQAAWARRGKDGTGCTIDLSMYDALLSMCVIPLASAMARLAGASGEPRQEVFGANPRYCTYRTRDGRAVAVSLLEARAWAAFCGAIGRTDLVREDESHADRLTDHGEHGLRYREAIANYCASRDRDDLVSEMRSLGIAISPVLDPDEALALDHAQARGDIDWIEHPVEGRMPQLLTPLHQSGLASRPRPAPVLGEHTLAVLREVGASSESIDRALACGALVQWQPERRGG